jgi:hypothetical protein
MNISTIIPQNVTSYFIILAFLFLPGCCTFSQKELEFSANYNLFLASYHVGDTIYFSSGTGDIDTITVSEIDTREDCGSGIMGYPHRSIWIKIKHLPNNLWTDGTESTQQGPEKVLDQTLLAIEKYPSDNHYYIAIYYQDFLAGLDTFPAVVTGNLLADLDVKEYWQIKTDTSIKHQNESSVAEVIWTTKFGLTAYYKRNGEFYKLLTIVHSTEK